MKAKSFQDLKAMRAQLAEAEQRAAQAAAERERTARQARADQDLFARAIGPTQPLRAHGRVVHAPAPTPPEPRQRALDEQAVLRESLSDEFDSSTLLRGQNRCGAERHDGNNCSQFFHDHFSL